MLPVSVYVKDVKNPANTKGVLVGNLSPESLSVIGEICSRSKKIGTVMLPEATIPGATGHKMPGIFCLLSWLGGGSEECRLVMDEFPVPETAAPEPSTAAADPIDTDIFSGADADGEE